ncbi:MAG TPA: hypothetical protein VEV84_07810 [Pyrinomonadaceae bacterium]|nr:hypothetical protein [Pyrinomonadaceae bacterium]
MLEIPMARVCAFRSITFAVIVSILAFTTSFAQTAGRRYDVELAVPNGKKTAMTDAVLIFNEKSFQLVPDKTNFKSASKEFGYNDLKSADASYAKKPMLSGGGAVATAVLLGVFVLPFLFIKKKKHWMTVQAEKEFAVMQLGDNNWREIAAEFQTHGVKVNDLKEQDK